MARLQILELPEGGSDDRPPFMLVIDEIPDDETERIINSQASIDAVAKAAGARAVAVFHGMTIDIPANDVPLGSDSQPLLREDVRVLDGPRLAHGRTDIARDMDRLAKWKNELADALGIDRTRNWDDIRNTAAALRKERDAQAETLERIRNLPEQPEIMDAQHPDPSGYLHGYKAAVRDAKRATYAFRATTQKLPGDAEPDA